MSGQITCTNHGPQENASEDEKDKFYDDLNIEVERAEHCGEQILIVENLNAKLGHPIIKNDVYDISTNGRLLKEVVDEHGLCVANSLNKYTDRYVDTYSKFQKQNLKNQ